ncbi:hypothetical protein HanRHA438_Chr15g0723261 [Helianthus annuus]|uniref:Uncharacterized protein n=1 Tax=Helianthus annuus TaxID=4232 RepID=A0A251SAR2_HELAN|nr:hypothetical protein HanXRQr2_Chr15g0711091 [Helianthus annuus]KAJ0441873.1 hypothetical protein HanIR_Chr16g0802761 [Helianthus annuus]KAJ0452514.1 hypothetical protein HanHA300_Chr15g0579821 [Helianthus annuus]KAJ0457437.1 hypothetical protein HanIR_Chr15g0773741 [Helianthus annuus]KAJ0474415.1 hypothetical protein HanHA89_Chr15g0629471 [Helianthus annuus]
MTAASSRVLICQVVAGCSFSMVFGLLTGIIRWIWRLSWVLVFFSAQIRWTFSMVAGCSFSMVFGWLTGIIRWILQVNDGCD